MKKFLITIVGAFWLAGIVAISPAHAAPYVDSLQQKEYTGVASSLPYSITTDEYNFTFYPKRAYVQPNQEILYQFGISNKKSSAVPIRFAQVDVYRYMPYGITGFGTFDADPEVAIQDIEEEDFDIPGGGKKTMTFKIKVPSLSDLGDRKEICIGAMLESEQNRARNQIAALNACTPIVRDAKQLATVKSVYGKVYGRSAQNVDLEYWVPRYLREKMNAKTLESTMIFWKQKQGSTVIPPALITKNDIPTLFKSVYGRTPLASEQKYWEGRLKDKSTKDAMIGAMSFQKSKGKSPKVLGVKSNDVYSVDIRDNTATSGPGELVTYMVKITNKYTENKALTPSVSITAKGLEIPTVSDHGKREKLANGKLGESISWNYLEGSQTKLAYPVEIDTNKSHTFTFQVKSPNSLGSEYCVEVYVFPFLQNKDCNTVVKSSKKPTSSKMPVVSSKPTVKVAAKDFVLTGPNVLEVDPDDQEITWRVTEKVRALYPNVKIELCPGKDFKNCIILDAVAENDGSQKINMPTVPRMGKWYLRIIGRNSTNGLVPSVSILRLVTLDK